MYYERMDQNSRACLFFLQLMLDNAYLRSHNFTLLFQKKGTDKPYLNIYASLRIGNWTKLKSGLNRNFVKRQTPLSFVWFSRFFSLRNKPSATAQPRARYAIVDRQPYYSAMFKKTRSKLNTKNYLHQNSLIIYWKLAEIWTVKTSIW